MASVLAYIRTEGDCAVPAALETLGEARRIATTLGASLYALVASSAEASELSDLITTLSRHGADRVALIKVPDADGPCVWATCGAALWAATERVRPNLVLFTADAAGRDIAPRLAARLGAAFFAEPSIYYGCHGEIVLARTSFGATYHERLSADEIDIPAVVTLSPRAFQTAAGKDDAEVLTIDSGVTEPDFELIDSSVDPDAALESARIICAAGAGCDAETTRLVVELAEALGAEMAATRNGCLAGLAPSGRMVDVSGRNISPDVYFACGASGSIGHLAAVSADAEIVALNSDPEAPIFRVASYGLVGDLRDTLPALIAEIRRRPPSSDPLP